MEVPEMSIRNIFQYFNIDELFALLKEYETYQQQIMDATDGPIISKIWEQYQIVTGKLDAIRAAIQIQIKRKQCLGILKK